MHDHPDSGLMCTPQLYIMTFVMLCRLPLGVRCPTGRSRCRCLPLCPGGRYRPIPTETRTSRQSVRGTNSRRCVCVCVCVCTCMRVCACMRAWYVHVHVCMCVEYTCRYIQCMYMCIGKCVAKSSLRVCNCVCVCVCVCVLYNVQYSSQVR